MIGNSWDFYLKEEFNKDYFKGIINEVNKRYQNTICYPPKNEIFNAFRLTPYEKVKVVIIGQDPYHGEHQAEGL
ncbi:MAG: uracil-DNA glycosylase, partial [Bacilli bacterium]|nr:uracil-DNA glycosylase [Bacilli bacterium]